MSFVTPAALTASSHKKGELVIAGSGLASVRQMTLEVVDFIERADVVFYCISDAFTVAFIQDKAKEHHDLSQYYDQEAGKHRAETYVQMAEVMLRRVRQGQLVCGIFYGHPGVFVNPSLRAIQIARDEGYQAKMLPGISAEDCLFADVGIDPANPGCLTYEATDMLVNRRPLNTSSHLVVWQIGAVGELALQTENEQLPYLLDYLEVAYGPHHPVVHYISGVNPGATSTMDRLPLSDLRRPEVANQINFASTLYVPPKSEHWSRPLPIQSALRITYPDHAVAPTYGTFERQAVAKLDSFVPPDVFREITASPALRQAAVAFALRHHRLREPGMCNLADLVSDPDELAPHERAALAAGDVAAVASALGGHIGAILVVILTLEVVDAPGDNKSAQAEMVIERVRSAAVQAAAA